MFGRIRRFIAWIPDIAYFLMSLASAGTYESMQTLGGLHPKPYSNAFGLGIYALLCFAVMFFKRDGNIGFLVRFALVLMALLSLAYFVGYVLIMCGMI